MKEEHIGFQSTGLICGGGGQGQVKAHGGGSEDRDLGAMRLITRVVVIVGGLQRQPSRLDMETKMKGSVL